MYGPVKECHCGCPEFSVAGCYANVRCWAQSLVIRVLKDSLLYPPPNPACSHVPGPTGPPFSTIQPSCDVKSRTFFWTSACFEGRACASITNPLVMHMCTSTPGAPLFSPAVLHLHIVSLFHLFFSFPPSPVGTSMFYVSLKGFGPRLWEEQCSLRGFLNMSELLTLHVSLFWSVKRKLLNNCLCIIQTWWGKRQGFYENPLRLALITRKWYLFQIQCDF